MKLTDIIDKVANKFSLKDDINLKNKCLKLCMDKLESCDLTKNIEAYFETIALSFYARESKNRRIQVAHPLVVESILVDVYLFGTFQFSANQLTLLDLRRQIICSNMSGYSIKINPNFYHLFDTDANIENFEVIIDEHGEVSDWFPEYYLNSTYGWVSVFNEALTFVIKLRNS